MTSSFADQYEIVVGISGKTIADINRVYTSEEEFIEALKQDRVSLRDDIVEKLKRYHSI